jgi:murein DD-endopeptidase MepM/ murein hydrolase activator NlpD
MMKKRYLPGLFLSGLLLLIALGLSAQQLANEPAGGMDDLELEAEAKRIPPAGNALLPASLDFFPLNKYYSTWDTLCVRRYADPINTINDTIVLKLVQDGSKSFVFPKKGQLLSPFGYRGRRVHAGVDIKLNLNDSVLAAFDGVVRMARYYAGYGKCVVIRHYNGLETLYSHLSKIKVRVNQPVAAGDLVGFGGSTGRASCNHLHFETRFQGQAFNPKQLIDFESFSLVSDSLIISKHTFGRSRDYMPGDKTLVASTESNFDYKSGKATKKSGSKKYHTVKSGDTLYSISKKHGTTVKKLCALNGIKSTKLLQLGTRLRVK